MHCNKTILIVLTALYLSLAAINLAQTAVGADSVQFTPLPGQEHIFRQADSLKIRTPYIEPLNTSNMVIRKPADYASDCTVFVDYPSYALYDWLIGMEVYAAYQDVRFPLVDCDTTYPFIVTHIGMTLVLNAPGSLWVAVLLAEVDPIYSSPICPIPGEYFAMSEYYPVYVPAADVYSLMIAFETPVPVYEPYFACFYFATDISYMYPGIAIDSIPYLCINYNDWGEGYVDLATNEWYPFPGSIHLFSVGYSKLGRLPKPRFIFPADSGVIFPGQKAWVAELQDTFPYQSAKFDYYKSGQWYNFGADFDGTIPLRDGVQVASPGDGWSRTWLTYGLPEGNYLLRASIADLDSTYVADTINVYLDLNSLTPSFDGQFDFDVICGPESVIVSIEDENPTAVTFGYYQLPTLVEHQFLQLDRNYYGDTNGDSTDGNSRYTGEFGDYYSAPVLFTSMIKYWYDLGYIELMIEEAQFLTVDQVVEKLAEQFGTRRNRGTEDDNLAIGITEYLQTHGARMVADIAREPTWEWFKSQYIAHEATMALAIINPFGHWLAVQRIDYQGATADSLPMVLYDPIGGQLRNSYLLIDGDMLYLGYLPNNKKYLIDFAAAIHSAEETVTYVSFATDFDPLDGFGAVLPDQQLNEDFSYLIRARALDANDDVADGYWVLHYDCNSIWIPGDADGSGVIEISDPVYLIAYIFSGGPTPTPTLLAGDADCDYEVIITDVVYLISYIFNNGPTPCSP